MTPEYLDRLPADWFVLEVMPQKDGGQDWTALVIDVDPDDLKRCECDFPALFYVDPDDYRPRFRKAHQGWLRIPGKHRNQDTAWNALQDILAARH
jgi:hypothetical protein